MKFSEIFFQTSHRPYPLPNKSWLMKQTWYDLLFMHWEIPKDHLLPFVPPGLELDTFNGKAYIAVVPFGMSQIRYRFLPPIPFTSAFLELNVRTYVKKDNIPGVLFLSLDAANPVAVEVARFFFYLPYFNAQMSLQKQDNRIHYSSIRKDKRGKIATLKIEYQPTSQVYNSTPNTLEHWLTERYCLYSANKKGILHRTDIHHIPWPLQKAEAKILENTMALSHGINLPTVFPILHFVEKIEVAIYAPDTQ